MHRLVKAALTITLLASSAWSQTVNSQQVWAANIISASHSGTLFITPVGNLSNATESNASQLAGVAGTFSNLYVNATAPGGSDTIVVTIDKNTTGQTLTCTVSAAGTACNDTTHSFTVVATDLISTKAVYSTAVTGAVSVTMSFTTTGGSTSGVSFNGHTLYSGSSPTLSLCGTSPTNTNSTDNAGLVTLGTGTVQSCTVTFSTAFTNVPACNVESNSNAGQPWISAVATTAVTFTLPQTGATKLYYSCF